ncbi:MAG: hypothetical protein AAF772_17530, partial [Acidobacteriota bacterium]
MNALARSDAPTAARPLAGARVVITRAVHQAGPFCDAFAAVGATLVPQPHQAVDAGYGRACIAVIQHRGRLQEAREHRLHPAAESVLRQRILIDRAQPHPIAVGDRSSKRPRTQGLDGRVGARVIGRTVEVARDDAGTPLVHASDRGLGIGTELS